MTERFAYKMKTTKLNWIKFLWSQIADILHQTIANHESKDTGRIGNPYCEVSLKKYIIPIKERQKLDRYEKIHMRFSG